MEKKEKPILERWHGAHHYSNKVHILLLFFLFFSAGLLLWSYFEINGIQTKIANKQTAVTSPTPSPSQQVACPMIAKLCPDGVSYVGETGPNCSFQACPGEHCGGNIKNPPLCSTGYHCQLDVSTPDTGGTCAAD